MDAKEKSDLPTDDNLDNVEDSYSIPSTSSLRNEDYLGSEEEELLDLGEPQDETHKKDESSSEGAIDCDEWQDLGKSDYAKVIFCDLYYEPVSGNVGCKFEITDSVHEDPCDYIGLFHIGFEHLNECLAFKPLSESNCEDDGKLLRCDFKYKDISELDMGFYQFLYITHDKEICGASMPFEIKPERNSLSPDSAIAEKVDEDDFLLVCHGLEKKNEQLLKQLAESRETNRELCNAMVTSAKDRSACDAEKMAILESFKNTIESLRNKLAMETAQTNDLKENMKAMDEENNKIIKEQLQNKSVISMKEKYIQDLLGAYDELVKSKNDSEEVLEKQIKCIKAEKDVLETQICDEKIKTQLLEEQKSTLEKQTKVLEEQIKCIKAENDLLKIQFCDLKIKTQLLEEQKSALEKEAEKLKLQDVRLHTLEEKNACLETELAHFQRSRSYFHSGVEEVKDLEFMVKALEQSKKLATKEISCLSKMLLNTLEDVNTLTAKLKDCEKELEDKKASETTAMEKIEALTPEVKENQDGVEKLTFEKHVAEVQKLKAELTDCEESLKQSQNSETKAKQEILKLRKELSECTLKLEQQCAVELKLQDTSKGIMDVIIKADKEVSELYYLTASWKPGSQSMSDFRTKKCAVLSKCGIIKDNLKILNTKSQEQLELSIECSIAEEERDKREARVTLLKTQLKEKEADNQKLTVEMSNVAQKCSELEEEEKALKTELESMEAQFHEKDACFQKLHVEMSNVAQKCSELEEEKKALKTELETVQAQLHEKEACFQKLKKAMSNVTQEYSNLEGKIKEFNNQCTYYENNFLIKETDLLMLGEEIIKKNELIKSLKNEKEEEIQRLMKELTDCQESLKQFQNSKEKENVSTSKEKELQELVNDHVARLSEAAKLYKKQYKEIEKLKKKLTKSKKESQLPSSLLTETTHSWTSSFSDVAGTSHDTPINILINATRSTPPAEMLVLSRNSNDSDTGERVSEGSSKSAKEKTLKSILALENPPRPNSTNERSALYKSLLTKSKKQETSIDKSSMLDNENPKLVNMKRVEDGNHSQIRGLPLSDAIEAVGPSKSGEATTSSQTQKEPDNKVCRVSICPYCGMAFKKYMPKVFLAHHITQHVLKYEKPAHDMRKSSSKKISNIPEKVFSNGRTNGEAEKMYSVPCPMCKEVFYVSCKTMEALAKHLKEQHDSMMCHCCGILFDKYTPSHFIADHMCQHFQLEQA